MIDINTTQNNLDELATRLDKADPGAAVRLRRLSDAIGGGPLADSWAANDIHKLIDIDSIVERSKSQGMSGRLTGVLEWVRNFLILTPLILTWFGISKAVDGYGAFLKTDPTQASQPFLLLWQEGFGGHLAWDLTLSKLALGDFILLSIILVLTALSSWQAHLIDIHKEQQGERLRAELADVLARSALCFSVQQQQQPNDFSSVVRRMDAVIQQVLTRLDGVSQHFEQTSQQFLIELQEERKRRGDLTAFLQALDQIAQKMLLAASAVQQGSNKLTASVNDLLVPVKEIPGQQKEILQAANGATTILGTATNSLQQLVRDQQGFVQNVYKTMNTSLDQLIVQQGQFGRNFTDALDTVDTTLGRMGQLIQNIEQSTAQQAHFITVIENEQKSQANLTAQMTSSATEMRDALRAVQHLTPEARSMAEDMSKFLRALKDIPASLKTELYDPLKHYSYAADQVSAGATAIGKAAQVMQQAGQNLESAAAQLNGSRTI